MLARPESPHIDFEWNFKSDRLLGQWLQKSFRPEEAAELGFVISCSTLLRIPLFGLNKVARFDLTTEDTETHCFH